MKISVSVSFMHSMQHTIEKSIWLKEKLHWYEMLVCFDVALTTTLCFSIGVIDQSVQCSMDAVWDTEHMYIICQPT